MCSPHFSSSPVWPRLSQIVPYPPRARQRLLRRRRVRTPTPVTFAQGNDWPQYRYDVVGAEVNPEDTLTAANVAGLRNRWTVKKPQGFYTTPAIVDGTVYAPSGVSLYAIDLLTGVTRWQFDGEAENRGGIHSSVAIDQKRKLAFFGTPAANFYAVDITTGKQRWVRCSCDRRPPAPSSGAHRWWSMIASMSAWRLKETTRAFAALSLRMNPDTGDTVWSALHGSSGSAGRRCLVVADR